MKPTISLPLTRQECEHIYHTIFPTMEEMVKVQYMVNEPDSPGYYATAVVEEVFGQVDKKFEHKIYNTYSSHFKIKLTAAEALTLYRFYFNYPIHSEQYWSNNLRNRICEAIHQFIVQPKMRQYATS